MFRMQVKLKGNAVKRDRMDYPRAIVGLLCVSVFIVAVNSQLAYSENKGEFVNYDDDFELFVDNNQETVRSVGNHEDGPLTSDNDFAEMTTSQCTTRDRTRTCDCGFLNQNFAVPIFSGNMLQVTIRNCKRVIIRGSTFSNIYNVAHLELDNIEDLVLHSNSLSFPIADWGHVNIRLRNVRVDFIPAHTFNGFIQSIVIQNSVIGTIERFAANGILSTLHSLEISDTKITDQESYAFKKFTTNSLVLHNVTATNPVASKYFYGIQVNGPFRISNCNFGHVHSSAFDMTDVNTFTLNDNHIGHLSGESFRMALLNGVTITGNHIIECHPSAFRAMNMSSSYWRHHNEPMSFRLITNSLGMPEAIMPLMISDNFAVTIDSLKILNPVHCDDLDALDDNSFFNLHRESTLFRMFDKLLGGAETEEEFMSLSHIRNHLCVTKSFFWYYILFGGLLILILLLIILVVLCVWYRRRKQQQLSLIMPDGRTYRETTIVMQIENHNLLKTDL